MEFLDANAIAFTILNYPLSYLELIATSFGLVSVYLASRPSIFTWPTGIVNEFCFFLLFYQVQLYADMLLQVYFFIVTVYGWLYWRAPKEVHPIRTIKGQYWWQLISLLMLGTLLLGLTISKLHIIAPSIFPLPAAFPFIDAFTSIASILAMVLLARKLLESWLFWIVVDAVSIVLYSAKGIFLVSIEYAVFLVIATYGYFHWRRQLGA